MALALVLGCVLVLHGAPTYFALAGSSTFLPTTNSPAVYDWGSNKGAAAGLISYILQNPSNPNCAGGYDIHTIHPDGTSDVNLGQIATTPGYSNGEMTWTPDGNTVAFAAAQSTFPCGTEPGIGTGFDVYVADYPAFAHVTKLTTVTATGQVLTPRWSADGTRLAWAQKNSSAGGWFINVGTLVFAGATPSVNTVVGTVVGGGTPWVLEPDAFGPLGHALLYVATGSGAFPELDLVSVVVNDDNTMGTVTMLASGTDPACNPTPLWNEFAVFPSNGNNSWIFYSSSCGRFEVALPLDIWAMHPDGSAKTRLTGYNWPGFPDYQSGLRYRNTMGIISPNGRTLMFNASVGNTRIVKSYSVKWGSEVSGRAAISSGAGLM